MKILKELKFFNDDTGKQFDLENPDRNEDDVFDDEDEWFSDDSRPAIDDSELEDLEFEPQYDDFDIDDSDDSEFEKSPFDQDSDDSEFGDTDLEDFDLDSDEDFELGSDYDGEDGYGTEDDIDADEKLVDDEESNEFSEDGYDAEDAESTEDDADYQGTIRTVKGAYLVFKRQDTDGTYNELWIYNIGKDLKTETNIKRSILAGTDIPATKTSSPDGAQRVEAHSLGNIQFLNITGLPN
jgi:hypothetical protein